MVAMSWVGFSFGLQASGSYINGTISFTGNAYLNGAIGSATAFTNFGNVFVMVDTNGSYAPLKTGAVIAWSPFSFGPPSTPVTPMWTSTSNGITYSFDATSVVITFSNNSFLNIQGAGIAHITGYADTPGRWIFSAQQIGSSVSFSDTTIINVTNLPTIHCGPPTNGTLQMIWNNLPGQPYQLQTTTNAGQPAWSDTGGVITAAIATNTMITNLYSVGSEPGRFFRVVLLPQ
jgi:hypothetical protein